MRVWKFPWPRPRLPLLLPWMLVLAAVLPAAGATSTARPIVAAASDLQFALTDVAERFSAETGRSVRLNFGSSGNFRRQIAQGAPFELYLSADEAYVEALHRDGHTADAGVLYAVGRVVVIAPTAEGGADIVDGSLEALARKLAAGEIRRFAIANPTHAPYGVAARQVLESAGLWERIRPHLVFGENVSQAARYALSGDTDGGIVAYSLALAPTLSERADYELVPAAWHEPLRQRMALIDGAGETARAFYQYIQGETAQRILAEYGFVVPEDD
jgi:molybdate transport system substrate-binding protein